MNFDFSQEQEMLRDSVKRFVADQYQFSKRQRILASDAGMDFQHWQTFAELGWLAMPFSADHGGFDGGNDEIAVLMQEFGYGLVAEPYFATVLMFGRLIQSIGSEAQKQAILPKLIAGDLQGSVAYLERRGGYELSDVSTKVVSNQDGCVISGEKVLVLNQRNADYYIVSARSAGGQNDIEGIGLYLVKADSPSIDKTEIQMMDGQKVANIRFDNVSAEVLLDEAGQAYTHLVGLQQSCVLALAAEALGIMDALYTKTLAYVKQRKQFDAPIGSFQVVQHRMVDMYIELEQYKSLVYRALCAASNQDDEVACLYALKFKLGDTGRRIWEDSIQLHGGMGMTDEMDIGHYVKRLMAINVSFGDDDFQLDGFIKHSYQ